MNKKYYEFVYGNNGLMSKYAYIVKVMESCKTLKQLSNAYCWGCEIIQMYKLKKHDFNVPLKICFKMTDSCYAIKHAIDQKYIDLSIKL